MSTAGHTLDEVLEFRQEMFERSKEIVRTKGADYNRQQQLEGDTLFNLRVCALLGIVDLPEQGLLVRLSDKLCRLVSLVNAPPAVENESFEDTVIDIHNYVDYLALMRRKRMEPKPIVVSVGGPDTWPGKVVPR